MQQVAIHAINAAAVVIILIGIPAICSRQIGPVQLTSTPDAQWLTLWGLALSSVLNFAGMRWLARGKKAKLACRNWGLAHAGILLLEFLLYRRQFHFNWLKDALLWIKERLSSKK